MEIGKYIGEKIKYFRNQKGLTQEDLANKLNLGKGTISNYESGYRTPKEKRLFELAEILGISINDLFPPTVQSKDIYDIYSQLNDENKSKVYNYAFNLREEQNSEVQESNVVYIQSKLSAGTGIVDLDPSHVEEMEYDGYIPKHDLAFIVSGDSMTPTFEDGEIVFVEKSADIRSGQFIAVQINDEAYIKKAYLGNDRLRLVSLNKNYEDIYANENDDIRVVGRVIL